MVTIPADVVHWHNGAASDSGFTHIAINTRFIWVLPSGMLLQAEKSTTINKHQKQIEYEKLLFIPLLLLSLTTMAACSPDDDPVPPTEQPPLPVPGDEGNPDDSQNPANPDEPDTPSENGNMLVVYFSAQGHTQSRSGTNCAEFTGADIHRIEAAEPYATNPYDDSDQYPAREAYNDLRPGGNLPDKKLSRNMIRFSSVRLAVASTRDGGLYVLEAYDLKDKVIIPCTYGATTYLNESMQKFTR